MFMDDRTWNIVKIIACLIALVLCGVMVVGGGYLVLTKGFFNMGGGWLLPLLAW